MSRVVVKRIYDLVRDVISSSKSLLTKRLVCGRVASTKRIEQITMKPTQALAKNMARKLQLTGKTGPKNFYKGWGSGSMGEHTKYGGYKINYDKVRSYVVPDGLDKFKVCN